VCTTIKLIARAGAAASLAAAIGQAAAAFVAVGSAGDSNREKEEVMSVGKLNGLKRSIPIVLTALLFTAVTHAQQPGAANADQNKQEKVAALKQSVAQNQAALRQYTWTEATEISLKGEVKKREQKQCHYGPDGKVMKMPIQSGDQGSDQAQQQQQTGRRGRRGGRMKEAIVEHKVGELKDYMEQVAALVHEYVPPDPQRIQDSAAAGKVSLQPSQGISIITIRDYLKAGDSVALSFDPNAKKIRSYNVQTFLKDPKDDPVTLNVTFASLPDGTNYAQQTVLDAPGKKIRVKTTNSGYAKAG
jgi:hypothetical protein